MIMATYTDYTKYVASKMTKRDLLEQLAEEASELSHAALKLIRAAEMNDNVTNVDKMKGAYNLAEEFADVENCYNVLRLIMSDTDCCDFFENGNIDDMMDYKMKRWAKRLRLRYQED